MHSRTSTGFTDRVSTPRRDDVGASDLAAFFRYHGVWAPGVRLFRRLNFQAKAMIVSLAFLAPLLVLGWSFNAAKQAELDFVVAERQGIAYADQLTRLTTAMLRERQLSRSKARGEAASALPAAREETDRVWQAVLAQESRHGAALTTAEPFRAVGETLRQARALSGAGPDQIYTVYGAAISAQSALLEWVVDKSNLALDPEFGSYYLMDASMIAAPDLGLSAGRLRALMVNAISLGSVPDAQGLLAIDRERQTVSRRLAQLEASLGKVAQGTPGLLSRVSLEETKSATNKLIALVDPVVLGGPLPAQANELSAVGTRVVKAADEVVRHGLPALDEMLANRENGLRGMRAWINGLSMLCVVLALYLLYCFYRVTRGGMQEVRHHLAAMTDGDLTTFPRPWGRDEAASLMISLSEMQHSLRDVVCNVREASDVIVQSSSEIASGSMDLSARTERTASNLQESAASMEEIAVTVRQTADHAGEAVRLASGNAQVAEQGGEVIGNVVHTMQEIRQSSHKISEIIAVIDGIAFQTNILALNAAVEAARAGEQGRGFAVVAGEVRALAQRSATAAREIKSLIQDSVERVESGTNVVQRAGQTMGDIVSNAQQMNSLLTEIATGAREQSSGVSQVGQAVQDLDRVTQENAALVEETAAAAESLKRQAHVLAQAVASFKLP